MKIRKLEEVCGGDFISELYDIDYCQLAMGGKPVECKYISRELDHNGLKQCNYRVLRKLEAMENAYKN